MKIGLGRPLFTTKYGPAVLAAKSGLGVETADCLVKIVYCIVWETMTRRHITNLVPGVGPRPLLVGKSGLV